MRIATSVSPGTDRPGDRDLQVVDLGPQALVPRQLVGGVQARGPRGARSRRTNGRGGPAPPRLRRFDEAFLRVLADGLQHLVAALGVRAVGEHERLVDETRDHVDDQVGRHVVVGDDRFQRFERPAAREHRHAQRRPDARLGSRRSYDQSIAARSV